MTRKVVPRQQLRRALIFVAFLLFPLLINFFSPYLVVDGASQGIVNGSLLVFGALFLSALFLGRGWCGWACPAAGLGEACFFVQDKPARTGRADWIKWLIWVPWIGLIVAMVVVAGGYRTVDPLYNMDLATTAAGAIGRYVIYFAVVGTVLALSLAAGRRGFCHYVCWMAPFMILGRKVRNLLRWPALGLRSEPGRCISCNICTKNCPMSLEVMQMALDGKMEHSECILCGTCVDTCPKDAIHYCFASAGRPTQPRPQP
jgi:polyferredoxin